MFTLCWTRGCNLKRFNWLSVDKNSLLLLNLIVTNTFCFTATLSELWLKKRPWTQERKTGMLVAVRTHLDVIHSSRRLTSWVAKMAVFKMQRLEMPDWQMNLFRYYKFGGSEVAEIGGRSGFPGIGAFDSLPIYEELDDKPLCFWLAELF